MKNRWLLYYTILSNMFFSITRVQASNDQKIIFFLKIFLGKTLTSVPESWQKGKFSVLNIIWNVFYRRQEKLRSLNHIFT